MPEPDFVLSFPDSSPGEAELLAKRLRTMLREEIPKLRVEQMRSDPHSQDLGGLLGIFLSPGLLAEATTAAKVADPEVVSELTKTLVEHGRVFLGVAGGTFLFEIIKNAAFNMGVTVRIHRPETGESAVASAATTAKESRPRKERKKRRSRGRRSS